MKTPKMPLTYNNPLTAVFMRTLAWEIHEAERNDRKPLVKELVDNQVQTAREDLGLQRNSAGAPYAFIQSLRKTKPPLILGLTRPDGHLGGGGLKESAHE